MHRFGGVLRLLGESTEITSGCPSLPRSVKLSLNLISSLARICVQIPPSLLLLPLSWLLQVRYWRESFLSLFREGTNIPEEHQDKQLSVGPYLVVGAGAQQPVFS